MKKKIIYLTIALLTVSSIVFGVALNKIVFAQTPGGINANQGGTGYTSIPAYSWLAGGGTGALRLVASSSPTVGAITATSTTATSTFYGNVGIGVSTLSSNLKLQVDGGIGLANTALTTGGTNRVRTYPDNNHSWYYKDTGVGTTGTADVMTYLNNFVFRAADSSNSMVISAIGQVGINNSTPPTYSRMTISTTTGTHTLLLLQNTGATTNDEARIDFAMTSATPSIVAPNGARLGVVRTGANAQSDMYFSVNNSAGAITERMRILGATGYVGIATSSPDEALDIYAGNTTIDNNRSYKIRSTTGTRVSALTIDSGDNVVLGGPTGGDAYIRTGSNNVMRMTSAGSMLVGGTQAATLPLMTLSGTNGSLGLGTTTPFAKFGVSGTSNGTTNIVNVSTSTASATTTVFNIDRYGINDTKYGIYCEMYVADSAVAQSIPNGTTYTKSTDFASSTLTQSRYCSPSPTNSNITITKAGKYLVSGQVTISSATPNVVVRAALFRDGVEQSNVHGSTYVAAGALMTIPFVGITTSTSTSVFDVRYRHDQGAPVNITTAYSNLSLVYIGEAQ